VLVKPSEDRAEYLAAALEQLMCDKSARQSLVPTSVLSAKLFIEKLLDPWIDMLRGAVDASRIVRLPQISSVFGNKDIGAIEGRGIHR